MIVLTIVLSHVLLGVIQRLMNHDSINYCAKSRAAWCYSGANES